MIAALFVRADGPYAWRPDVDLWPEDRDARTYPGPWPVVAHPPCQRWGRYWFGSPSSPKRFKMGDDGGCFASALASVRRWGGVLEHPEGSHAWPHHGLCAPPEVGWGSADWVGGWTCSVEQGHFGHGARKVTWLYAVVPPELLPVLPWGRSEGAIVVPPPASEEERRRQRRRGKVELMSKKNRELTPPAFAEVLLSIARTGKG